MRPMCCTMLCFVLAGGIPWLAAAQAPQTPTEPAGMLCRLGNLETIAIDLPAPGAKPVYLWLEGLVFKPWGGGLIMPALRLCLNGCPLGPERLRGQEATYRFPANLAVSENCFPKFDPRSRAWRLCEARDFQVNDHIPYNGDRAWYHVEGFPGYYVFEVTDLVTNAMGRLEVTGILPYPQDKGASGEKRILLRRVVLTNRVDELRAGFEGEQVNFGRPPLRPAEEDVRDPGAASVLGSRIRARWPQMAAEMFRRAGMGSMEQGDALKAIGYFEQILKDFPDYTGAQEIRARLVRAYGVAGAAEKARAMAEEMSKANPGESWCKLARALIALSGKDYSNIGRPWLAVRPTGTPPRIDGNLDDACWRTAATIPSLNAFDNKDKWATNFPTMIWAAYDSTNLYLGFRCFIDSRQISVKALAHDAAVWEDECIEAFISPGLNFCYYYEFDINPLNTIYDGKNVNYYWIDRGWNPLWQHATRVQERYWEAEIAVPFAILEAQAPARGAAWLANFCRLVGPIMDEGKPYSQSQSWAPGFRDFHRLVDYGILIFE